jgi:hypothetical protein
MGTDVDQDTHQNLEILVVTLRTTRFKTNIVHLMFMVPYILVMYMFD